MPFRRARRSNTWRGSKMRGKPRWYPNCVSLRDSRLSWFWLTVLLCRHPSEESLSIYRKDKFIFQKFKPLALLRTTYVIIATHVFITIVVNPRVEKEWKFLYPWISVARSVLTLRAIPSALVSCPADAYQQHLVALMLSVPLLPIGGRDHSLWATLRLFPATGSRRRLARTHQPS